MSAEVKGVPETHDIPLRSVPLRPAGSHHLHNFQAIPLLFQRTEGWRNTLHHRPRRHFLGLSCKWYQTLWRQQLCSGTAEAWYFVFHLPVLKECSKDATLTS